MKKVISLILACALLLCFVSCSKDGAGSSDSSQTTANYGTFKDASGKAIDATLDWSLFESIIYQQMHNMMNYGYDAESLRADLALMNESAGKTNGELVKEDCLEQFKAFYTVLLYAKQQGITLTTEDRKAMDEEKSSLITQYGGKEAFAEALKGSHMSEANFNFQQEFITIREKLYNKLYAIGGEKELPAEQIVSDVSDNYLRVVHILIKAEEGSADFEDKTAYANEVLGRVNAGEDFITLMTELSEDPGSTSQPDGYVFDKEGYSMDGGQMVSEFVEGAWALEVGQHSDLVRTSYGYHIIKRLPLDADYITANYDNFYSYYSDQAFAEELGTFAETITFEPTEAYKSLDMTKFIHVEETTTPAQ